MKKKRCAECSRRLTAQIEATEAWNAARAEILKMRESATTRERIAQRGVQEINWLGAELGRMRDGLATARADLEYDEGVMTKQRERLIALVNISDFSWVMARQLDEADRSNPQTRDLRGTRWIRVDKHWLIMVSEARELIHLLNTFKVDHMMGLEQKR